MRFSKLNGDATWDREPPARRVGVILSSIFLLSLATVATMTGGHAKAAEQDSASVTVSALSSGTTR